MIYMNKTLFGLFLIAAGPCLSADAQEKSLPPIPSLIFDRNTAMKAVGTIAVDDGAMSLYFYERIWGQAGRSTKKLVIFCEEKFEGMYSLPSAPVSVSDKTVHFNLDAQLGSKLTFSTCQLPQSIYLDGELYALEH